ncbi:MAG TPA: gluconokinase, GntK/IdnK-type [Nitrospira sp.]|nr:gluconokinase, GntK/IdnK-type [Nitrospira sp.]
MVIVLMGVAGAGKTTVGRHLAASLGWNFCDADEFHLSENIDKMARGIALSETDRRPWLEDLRRAVLGWVSGDLDVVLACSLLRQSYRDAVSGGDHVAVKLAYLKAPRPLLECRLAGRHGHFAGTSLLQSQLQTLEEPADAVVLDAGLTPDQLVGQIRTAFGL